MMKTIKEGYVVYNPKTNLAFGPRYESYFTSLYQAKVRQERENYLRSTNDFKIYKIKLIITEEVLPDTTEEIIEPQH